jgi:3-dehydroquinate synthase
MRIYLRYHFLVTQKIKTEILYSTSLPPFKKLAAGPIFFIVDERAYRKNLKIKKWLTDAEFVYLVKSGEKLKDLNAFPKHIKKILQITEKLSHRELTLVAVGGGSLGDFSGFVAATLKRGVRFVQVPTTWLSAIDSSHGGKNALNVGSHKNQIGTFYHPDLVYISRAALSSQAAPQHQDALGELYKMALIEGKTTWAKKTITSENIDDTFLWNQLPYAVAAKYKIVNQDPDESMGLRYILNLGHTIGHVMELALNLSHGNAVSAGLKFALWYSFNRNIMSNSEWQKLQSSPMLNHCTSIGIKPISEHVILKALLNDKKKDSAKLIKFIFLISPGKIKIQAVPITELVQAFLTYQKLFLSRAAHTKPNQHSP